MTPIANPSPLPNGWWQAARRVWLLLMIFGFVAAATFVLLSAAFPSPEPITGPHWVSAVREDTLNVAEPVRLAEERVWLVKLGSGEILALSQTDPHLGCTVPWRGDFTFLGTTGWFRNPCHGETYDLTGYCYAGPCPRGLDRYETRIADGKVEVLVGEGALILGPALVPAEQRLPVGPPPAAQDGDHEFLGPVGDLATLSPVEVAAHGFFLVKLESGDIIALSNRDPYAENRADFTGRCAGVEWRSDMVIGGVTGWFRAPCSGSTYEPTGARVSGPAPRSMDRYGVTIEGDAIRVDTDVRYCQRVEAEALVNVACP